MVLVPLSSKEDSSEIVQIFENQEAQVDKKIEENGEV